MKKLIKALTLRFGKSWYPMLGGMIGLIIGICYANIIPLGPLLALIFVTNILIGMFI